MSEKPDPCSLGGVYPAVKADDVPPIEELQKKYLGHDAAAPVPTPVTTRQDTIEVLQNKVRSLEIDLLGDAKTKEDLKHALEHVDAPQKELAVVKQEKSQFLNERRVDRGYATDLEKQYDALSKEALNLRRENHSLCGPSLLNRLCSRVAAMMSGGTSLIGNAFEPMASGVVGAMVALKFVLKFVAMTAPKFVIKNSWGGAKFVAMTAPKFVIKNSWGGAKFFACAAVRSIGCFTMLPLNLSDVRKRGGEDDEESLKRGGYTDGTATLFFFTTLAFVGLDICSATALRDAYQSGAWQKLAFQHPELAFRSAQFIAEHFGSVTNLLYTLGFGALCTNLWGGLILIGRNRRNRKRRKRICLIDEESTSEAKVLAPAVAAVPAVAPASSLLKPMDPMDTVTIPARERFVAKDKFIKDISPGAKVKISCIWSNFASWFLGKTEEAKGATTLRSNELLKSSVDGPIIAKLGGEAKAETSLSEVWSLMAAQPNGEAGVLLTTGYANNIFYVKDVSGALRAVCVGWGAGGWDVDAYSVSHPGEWRAGGRIFHRNSC